MLLSGDLSKSTDEDGLFNGGDFFFCMSKEPWIALIQLKSVP